MKKPAHSMTLATARDIIARHEAGETFIDAAAPRKAREVVAYWSAIRAKQAAGKPAVWVPSQAECDTIREVAASVAGTKAIRLEPGFRTPLDADSPRQDSMNIAIVSDDPNFEDTELADFRTWADFRKGVELSAEGNAVVDFYVQGREELLTNVTAYYQGGQLVAVCQFGRRNLLRNGLDYVAVVREVVDATPYVRVEAPALRIDALMARRLDDTAKLERRLVVNLIGLAAHRGWQLVSVWDGEETVNMGGSAATIEAMELVFNLAMSRLYFAKTVNGAQVKHSVLLVRGNGVDLVADWTLADGDADGFDKMMWDFDAADYV